MASETFSAAVAEAIEPGRPFEPAPRVPVTVTRIRPQSGWGGLDFRALWEYRELLYFLTWRDLKIRYKQTVLGGLWAVIQPVMTVLMFSIIFGRFAGLPSDGVPYHLNTFCALLPWGLFAGAVNRSATSLVSSANLISKVYFPRLIIPVSAAMGALVDFCISLGVLLLLMAYHGKAPTAFALTLPLWTAVVVLLGLAVGLGLSALNVRFRDVSYLVGFLLQIWMYASPVAYSASIVPAEWRWLYQLNPMTGLIQGFRWSLLDSAGPTGVPWVPAVAFTAVLLWLALSYFRRVERFFADII